MSDPYDRHYIDHCTCGGFFGADDNCPVHGHSKTRIFDRNLIESSICHRPEADEIVRDGSPFLYTEPESSKAVLGFTTDGKTLIAGIFDTIREFISKQPSKTVDVYLFTISEHRELMERGTPRGIFPDISFCGIPFEVYPTKDAVFERAYRLIQKGKRVGIVHDKTSTQKDKP